MSAKKSRLESLFEAAIAVECADARARFIKEQCSSDLQLRAELEQLLESDKAVGSFLEKPPAALRGIKQQTSTEQNRNAALNAGLASAFNMNEAIVVGSPNPSVLLSLCATVDVPRVALRESEADGGDPISRPTSSELPPPDTDSRYQLQGEIARGGMGAILKGRDTDLGRDLAVKVLLDEHKAKPAVIQRFIEEAQIGGQLQHPGIAPVYELGMFADQRPYFSMKLVKGKTLSKLLSDRSSPSEDRHRFIAIFEQICQTMAYAHSRGVIHRDLKPANIMVGAFGEVQVMDWGLAKVLSTGGVADEKSAYAKHKDFSVIQTMRSAGSDSPLPFVSSNSETQMGSVIGTPAYMPPEQALGEIDQVDERADVFGLGAILCEILTGKPPYVADDSTQVYRLASRGKLADCMARLERCEADAELVTLTTQCLELEPKDRPRDASAVAARITDYLESVDIKLREAEMERAAQAARADAEAAKAIAESERAAAESRRAAEESKRRRVSLVLAASIVMFVALGSGGSLHMLQREAAQQKSARENTRRVLDLSLEVLAKSGTDPKTNREYTVRSALANLSDLLKATTSLQPETEAELHLGLGRAFLGGGDRTRAKHHLRRSLEIGSKVWDQNNPQLLSARRLEAYVSQSRVRLAEAIDMDRTSNDTAALVKSLTFLGDAAAQTGDTDTAESALKEAVEKFPEDQVDQFQFYEIPHLAFADVLRDLDDNDEAARIRSLGQRICKLRFGDLDEVWFRMAIQLEEAELTAAANRAFTVGLSCVPKTPVNWFRGRGQNYRKEGNFLKADIAFRFGVEHANARNDQGEAAFSQVSLGRQRYHVKDFEGAEPYIREAVQLASGGYAAAKINYEYGKILRNLGRTQEADEYLQTSIQHWDEISESNSDNSFLTPAMVDTFRIACQLLMRDNEPARQSVADFINDESVAGSYRGVVLAHAIMMYGGPDVDLERAAALLECSLHALGHPLTGNEMVIAAYVNVMDQLGRTERAIANLNRYRYVLCDLERDRTNFRRAEFRISIAKAMMARGLDRQKSKHLLSQAKEILEYNPLTPQPELNDLDRMITECDSAMQADRPVTIQVPE